MSVERVVIVGAGHAGGTAAALLRQYGYKGAITLIGEEPIAPYQRPPLSKAWLKGEADAESLLLKPDAFYAEHAVDLRLGVRVARLNVDAQTVELESGEALPYDAAILATGARARRLLVDGADLDGVLELRTAADADELKAALGPGKRLAVVGGGYVGLEAAASARALGAAVVVIEREARCLARVAAPVLSNFFEAYHRARGVEILCGTGLSGFEGAAGRVTGVRLDDGRVVPCDAALVGVGAVPNLDLARDAALACSNGVMVDGDARTSDPAVFAIGDVSFRPLPRYGRNGRLESVPNALEQAKQAACAIVDRPRPAAEVPWFWSDQYDLKLQIAGLSFGGEALVVRGDPDAAKFALFHLDGDVVQAVEAVNAPPEFMMGRKLIETRRPVDRARLADSAVSMKEVAA